MKLCIVKQPHTPGYTWKSHRWDGACNMLDDFMLRSKNFGLLYETQGDVWVVEPGGYRSSAVHQLEDKKPQELLALYEAQECVSWSEIPLGDYDVIITIDPIAPRNLIEQHKRALWCYCVSEHSSGDWRRSMTGPFGGYDLFLDHSLGKPDGEARPPTAVHFSSIVSRVAFRSVVDMSNRQDAVFLDSHAIRKVNDFSKFRQGLSERFGGLIIDHPRPWEYARSFGCVARREMMSTLEYLQRVANCKYFYMPRRGAPIGQALPEAAALGCVVLAGKDVKYAAKLCHPTTLMKNAGSFGEAAKVLARVQASKELQAEILAYQNSQLDSFFLNEPLCLLDSFLMIKRKSY